MRVRWLVRGRRALLACWLLLCMARPAPAQVCIGDCRSLGQVGISDLVLAVNIALGIVPLDRCPALGAGPVSIATLIASVSNALCDCRPCPTPPPATATPTRSATATESPTPTASPSPAPTVSTWREDNFKLGSTSCPRSINDAIRRELPGQVYDYTVRQLGEQVEIDDGAGNLTRGTIDGEGNFEAHEMVSRAEGACVVRFDIGYAVNLSHSPTSSKTTTSVSTMNCPNPTTCTFVITSRWTRTSPEPGASSRRM